MRLFAISDLHLPGGDDKPMNVFGQHWDNHFERIAADWRERVAQEDAVLIPGDISWAMQLKNALPDLQAIGELPGRKVILKGNHEHWWNTLTQVRSALPEGMEFTEVRALRSDALLPQHLRFAVLTGKHLADWYRDARYCGRCGGILEDSKTERALVCPHCGCVRYPKICPAVIVAVRDGDRLLLTKYAGRYIKNYALIAGFNEIGESIEETVHREVLEEVGVHVKNLQFYKSQPWVFTDTLLMGFFCDLDGTDKITLQESELSVGTWVRREDLPEDTAHLSLTGEMIEQFRLGLA